MITSIDIRNLGVIAEAHADFGPGLTVVTGETGAGKTTTLASLIEEINRTRRVHIVTLEDPIEYIFPPACAFLSQREAGRDFVSFSDAVRSALREDPDILRSRRGRDRRDGTVRDPGAAGGERRCVGDDL